MGSYEVHTDIQTAFLSLLRHHGIVTAELKALLFSAAYSLAYNSKNYLLKAGQIATQIWFLQSGYVRWYKDEEMGQATVWLSTPGNMIMIPFSFQRQLPSGYFLQAVCPCQTLCLEYNNVIHVGNEHPEFKSMLAKIADDHTAEMHEYAQVMRLDKGEDRMKYLYRKVGSDIYSLNARILSSFINMSESTFFKLRKKTCE